MIYVFGECALDTQRHTLRRAGQGIPVRRKVFQALTYLLAHHDRAISKQELCEQIWPQQFISEAALESTVKAVRRAIGDSGRGQQLIQTVYGYGYRFIAAVEAHSDTPPGPAREALCAPHETGSTATQDTHDMAFVPPKQGAAGDDDAGRTLPTTAEERPAPRDTSAPAGEWKLVTVLCCGLVEAPMGITSEEADARYRQMRELYALAQDVVKRYGGTVQPVLGECITAVFGAPVAQEDHAQRAALAAMDLQRRVCEVGLEGKSQRGDVLGLRVGVDTGQVAVGGIGESPVDLTVVGDTVTRAIALQARAALGAILCGETTAHLVQEVVRVEAWGPPPGAGASAPIAYTLLGRRAQRRPISHRETRVLTPLVGRRRELATLRDLCAATEGGQGYVVGIVGDPGVGKSRLLYELRRMLTRQPFRYLEGRCLAYGSVIPYLPVLDLLRSHCEVAEADPPETIAEKVRIGLHKVDMAPEEAPYLLQLLDVPVEVEGLAMLSPEALRARTFAVLCQMILRSSRQQCVILAVEDLHWIDQTSEDFFAALVERLAGVPIILLVTYRPGYRPPWIDKSYVTQIALKPLAPQDSLCMAASLFQTEEVSTYLVQSILAKAQGNPFFLEEIVQGLVDQGVLVRPGAIGATSQSPPLRKPLSELLLPPTVQGVLASRIDRLEPAAKGLLQTLAVIGPACSLRLLRQVAEQRDTDLPRLLSHLQRTEFLYEQPAFPEPEYIFKHALTQEVAYNSLLPGQRRAWHERAALAIETLFRDRLEERYSELAHHYSRSGNTMKAVEYLSLAGQQAVRRSAYAEAISHLTAAFDLLTTQPETRERSQQELVVQMTLGMALLASKSGSAPEVEQLYIRARALCERVGEPPQLFRVLWGLWLIYNARGDYQTMRALGEQLLSLAQRLEAPDLLLEAHHALWTSLFSGGELIAARAHQKQGLRLYDLQRHRAHAALYSGHDPGVCCRYRAAPPLWLLGYPDQALASSQAALVLAEQLAHPVSLALALYWAAVLHHLRREAPLTQARAEAMITLATDQGLSQYLGQATPLRGWALAASGQWEEGRTQIQQGLADYRATGAARDRPYYLTLLAEASTQVGQTTEGLEAVEEALATLAKSGVRWWEAELYRLRGELLLALESKKQEAKGKGQKVEEAEACFQQALAVACRQQARSLELRAAMSLSRLWRRQGKRAEACQLLASIYHWFTEGFDTADLQEAKALLGELS
ncbi:MAG: AAA family ATPase [Candidatus Entotheonellia bacterium]